MRKIHKLIPAVALALAGTKASAQVLYEPFNYTVGNPLETTAADPNKNYTTSGTYWAQRGSTTPPFTVGTGLGSPTFTGVATPADFATDDGRFGPVLQRQQRPYPGRWLRADL
jgi:hypothetical protein